MNDNESFYNNIMDENKKAIVYIYKRNKLHDDNDSKTYSLEFVGLYSGKIIQENNSSIFIPDEIDEEHNIGNKFINLSDSKCLDSEYVYAFPYYLNLDEDQNLNEQDIEDLINNKSIEANIIANYDLFQAYFTDNNSLTTCYNDPENEDDPIAINTDNCEGIITILSNEYVKIAEISALLKDLYDADIEIKKASEPLDVRSDELYNLITKKIICQNEHIKSIVATIVKNQKITNSKLKDNILICGPTGVGKSELFKCIKEHTDIPISIDDSYQFTGEGIVIKNISDMLYELYKNADGDLSKAERGIIVIDELDKKLSECAQADLYLSYIDSLLKISEGCKYQIQTSDEEFEIDTSFISFIFSGGFSGINHLNDNCKKMGFISNDDKPCVEDYKEKLLIKYGIKKEFLDNVKLIIFNNLCENDLFKILNESEISLLLLYKQFYEENGISFIYDDKCTEAIAKKALELGIGAKGIKKVLDYAFELINYEVFSNDGYTNLTIFPEIVDDNKKYILK